MTLYFTSSSSSANDKFIISDEWIIFFQPESRSLHNLTQFTLNWFVDLIKNWKTFIYIQWAPMRLKKRFFFHQQRNSIFKADCLVLLFFCCLMRSQFFTPPPQISRREIKNKISSRNFLLNPEVEETQELECKAQWNFQPSWMLEKGIKDKQKESENRRSPTTDTHTNEQANRSGGNVTRNSCQVFK